MIELPQISIIIPLFNVENYIADCLLSVTSQTYSGKIECIIVDDCGTDNSVSIVRQFMTDYSGMIDFRVLHHDFNRGLSAARNTGIISARGNYLLFLDSDDKLFPNSISTLIQIAETYPEAEIIQGSTTPGFILSEKTIPEFSNDINWIRAGLCTMRIPDPAWNKLVKRSFVQMNNLLFVEGYLQEDTIWNYQIQKHISAMAFCYDVTYWYRYNPNGIMNGMSALREANSYARVFNYVFNDLIKCEQIETYEIQYLIWNAKRVFGYVGKEKGNQLLVTQNNLRFRKVLRWSTGLSRVHIEPLRKILLKCVKYMVLVPNIKKLCKKENLLLNYCNVEHLLAE